MYVQKRETKHLTKKDQQITKEDKKRVKDTKHDRSDRNKQQDGNSSPCLSIITKP